MADSSQPKSDDRAVTLDSQDDLEENLLEEGLEKNRVEEFLDDTGSPEHTRAAEEQQLSAAAEDSSEEGASAADHGEGAEGGEIAADEIARARSADDDREPDALEAPGAVGADSESVETPEKRESMSMMSDAEVTISNRRVLAKVYGDDRRLDERRWAVGGSPRHCHACEAQIAPQVEFYATLKSTQIPSDDSKLAEVSALFDRYDYCCACYESDAAVGAFAYWKSVMDAPQREPRKVVNLAALLVYFQHLCPEVESPAAATVEDRGDDSYEAEQQAQEREAILKALPQIDGGDAELMCYLLALFLIRKRVLKWVNAHDGMLEVLETKTKVLRRLVEPRLTPKQLEEAVEAFEELFR